MPDKNLQAYLNHHLAASVAWLEAVDHLKSAERGTAMERALVELHAEVTADRGALEDLMKRVKVTESETQKATAWFGEKILRMMMPLKQERSGALHLFQALEALSLGVEGRRGMWIALSMLSQEIPALQGLNYQTLINRAEQQRERVEKLRLEAAAKAFRTNQ